MKALAICGSPRKGNTEAMLKRVLDGAKSKGAGIELIRLIDKNILECDGCSGCEGTKSCRISDEMPQIYAKVMDADALVLGSPNYFNNVSSLMKKFIDRMNPYWQDKRLQGKKVALVMPGGYSKESIEKGMRAFEEFPRICKMQVVGKIGEVLENPNEARSNEKLMKQCFELGEKLAG
ncbi:MAG: flavodoxin family protein [Candidatus Diapherotrites archaeon]|uniref:Flavodoxin family protein n=1 Tax=Candidatus Iainarchaeum sp. TaxID=3101447 RepID=A0A938YT91_9ARCH|nr:flavodoxin family protein [Candidatus Diapherotrites archaeon]